MEMRARAEASERTPRVVGSIDKPCFKAGLIVSIVYFSPGYRGVGKISPLLIPLDRAIIQDVYLAPA